MSRDLFVSLNTLSALFLHCPHCLSTLLSIPVPLPVSLSPTQFDAMLIRLLLISRIVLLPQTFEMYTPFNLFCLSGVVAWTPEKKKKLDCISPFALGCHVGVLGLPVFVCQCTSKCVHNCLPVNMCVIFRAQHLMLSAVGKTETGQGRSVCAHTAKASVLYLKTSIIVYSTHASVDTA